MATRTWSAVTRSKASNNLIVNGRLLGNRLLVNNVLRVGENNATNIATGNPPLVGRKTVASLPSETQKNTNGLRTNKESRHMNAMPFFKDRGPSMCGPLADPASIIQ